LINVGNADLRGCHQFPLRVIQDLVNDWSKDLQGLDLSKPKTELEYRDEIVQNIVPIWGQRQMAGCLQFASFYSNFYFCTDGKVTGKACPVSDKCPPMGQLIQSTLLNVSLDDSPAEVAPGSNTSAIGLGCWDVLKKSEKDPTATLEWVCQEPRGSSTKNATAPGGKQAFGLIPCPIPFKVMPSSLSDRGLATPSVTLPSENPLPTVVISNSNVEAASPISKSLIVTLSSVRTKPATIFYLFS
jgi:hypothetical protein